MARHRRLSLLPGMVRKKVFRQVRLRSYMRNSGNGDHSAVRMIAEVRRNVFASCRESERRKDIINLNVFDGN